MMSLSSVECVGVSPTASQANITDNILCTLIALFYTSVGGVCWVLRLWHIPWLIALSWTWLSVSLQTETFFPLLSDLFSFFIYLHFPSLMATAAMAYDHISPLSLHLDTSFSFFTSCVKFTGFSSSLHNSWVIWNLVPNIAGHSWVRFEITSENYLHTTEPPK